MKFFEKTVDFFEIFPSAFLGFQIQGAAEGDHIAQIANLSGRQLGNFGLREDGIPDLGELGFDASGVGLDGFAKGFANEVEFLRERLHR